MTYTYGVLDEFAVAYTAFWLTNTAPTVIQPSGNLVLGQFAANINPDSFALSNILAAFDSVAYWNQVFAASTSNSINVLAGNCVVSTSGTTSTTNSSVPSLVPTIPTAAQFALAGI